METNKQEKRSRRLRKKLYIDEYSVLGFEVSFRFENIDESSFDSFFDGICSFTESRNLIMGGAGGSDTFTLYISSHDRYGSATEEDRSAFQTWLSDSAFIVDAKVDDLSDAYYGI